MSQQINLVPITTTTVTATPNPVPFNSAYSITITVKPIPLRDASGNPIATTTPTGTVFLTSMGPVFFQNFDRTLGPFLLNAAGQVTVSFPTLSPFYEGLLTYSAVYSGDARNAPSTSAPAYVTFALPDGPHVNLITTNGNHASTKPLVVYFNEALYPLTSQDVNNFQITTANGRSHINVKHAVFNPLNNTVTLSLGSAVPINGRFSLTVIGKGLKGVTDADGRLLDGGFTGIPGSNFKTPLTFKNTFVKPHLPAAPKIARKR